MKRFILFIFLVLTVSLRAAGVHPYHVGSVEFNYSEKTKTFQITARFFMDDLETAVSKKYGTALHFKDEKFRAPMNAALARYAAEYLRVKSDGQFVTVNYLGYEEDHEGVNIYLESAPVNRPKKVEAAVSLLYSLFDDQINIIHIVVNGVRKSQKLTYPDRYLYQLF